MKPTSLNKNPAKGPKKVEAPTKLSKSAPTLYKKFTIQV